MNTRPKTSKIDRAPVHGVSGWALAGLLALTALAGCNRSSSRSCEVDEPGCVCTVDADDSPAPTCADELTAEGDPCTCTLPSDDNNDAGVLCLSDTECPDGLTCDVQSGQCVDPSAPGCDADDDCADGQRCDLARGACVEADDPGCRGPEDCMDGEVCDVDSGACMMAADPTCDDGIANQDESDVDCGGGCAPCGAGQACGGEADCVEGALCAAGRCDVPPRVRSQMPRPGASNVDPEGAIVVEFNDAIDPASVDRFSFIVSVQGESPDRPWDAGVAGQYAVSGRTVTFTPDAPLRTQNTVYQVKLCPPGPCPGTITDREGNALIDEGTEWTFTTLPVSPGRVFIANNRATNGDDRVSSGDGQNALVGRDAGRWQQWDMRHAGGGFYSFRAVDANFELVMASGPGDTHPAGRNNEWRNVTFGNNGTRFRVTPTGALNDGTPWYTLVSEDGFSLQLACPGGFCDPANLQANRGGDADVWFLLR